MRTNGLLASDVDLKMMAEKTKNFSGAEIEARIEFWLYLNFCLAFLKTLKYNVL